MLALAALVATATHAQGTVVDDTDAAVTIAPGSTRYYQAYYRDSNAAFCSNPPGNGWNVTNGWSTTW